MNITGSDFGGKLNYGGVDDEKIRAIDRYQKKWRDQLPENEQLTINGVTYVHWYDCITDYIL